MPLIFTTEFRKNFPNPKPILKENGAGDIKVKIITVMYNNNVANP